MMYLLSEKKTGYIIKFIIADATKRIEKRLEGNRSKC